MVNLGINVTRFADSKAPNLNQRIEVSAISNQSKFVSNLNSISLNVIQNNNFGLGFIIRNLMQRWEISCFFSTDEFGFPRK